MNFMKYKGYTARIEYSEHDHVFFGRVLGIKPIIGFHADNVHALENEFHNMIDFYLDCCRADGQRPERPPTGKVTVSLPIDAYAGVSQAAEEMGQSIDELVVSAVRAVYPCGRTGDKTEAKRKSPAKRGARTHSPRTYAKAR